jgi:hypothetical protein
MTSGDLARNVVDTLATGKPDLDLSLTDEGLLVAAGRLAGWQRARLPGVLGLLAVELNQRGGWSFRKIGSEFNIPTTTLFYFASPFRAVEEK